MSVGNCEGSTENLFDFKQPWASVETDNALIFEEITRELEAYLARDSDTRTRQMVFLTSYRQSPTQYKKNLTN